MTSRTTPCRPVVTTHITLMSEIRNVYLVRKPELKNFFGWKIYFKEIK
jgi:hypothetical protein